MCNPFHPKMPIIQNFDELENQIQNYKKKGVPVISKPISFLVPQPFCIDQSAGSETAQRHAMSRFYTSGENIYLS